MPPRNMERSIARSEGISRPVNKRGMDPSCRCQGAAADGLRRKAETLIVKIRREGKSRGEKPRGLFAPRGFGGELVHKRADERKNAVDDAFDSGGIGMQS